LIAYTPKAERQVKDLRQYYEDRERLGAVRGLLATLNEAERTIETNPAAGLAAPRPSPALTWPDLAWIKEGRYWIAYSRTEPPVIVGIFYEATDIPGRLHRSGVAHRMVSVVLKRIVIEQGEGGVVKIRVAAF